jgi:hypothetical protein
MPRLNLLAKNGNNAIAVLVQKLVFESSRVDSFEDLGAEWTNVVEILTLLDMMDSSKFCQLTDFDSMDCLGLNGA